MNSRVIVLFVKYTFIFDIESPGLTVEMQQYGKPVLGSNNFQLSCISKTEENEVVDRVTFFSKLNGTEFKSVIVFNIKDNLTVIINPAGSYLEDRVTLKNLFSSENRAVIEYNEITCEDNSEYRCDVQLINYNTESSNAHAIEVQGIVVVLFIPS